MKHKAWSRVPLVFACALALGACSKQIDPNPNAAAAPGTGNSAEVVRPAMPDSPPGGPSGIAGSQAHPGASGGSDAVANATGSGTLDASGRSQSAQPGTGLGGGLDAGRGTAMGAPPAGTATPGESTAGSGSSNATPSTAVGSRP